MSLFQLVHVSHRAKLSWITASHQLLLGGNTLPTECGEGEGEGGRGGGAEILQPLFILNPGKATYQVKKTKIVTNTKVKGMTVAVVAVVTEVTLIIFQIDLVG